MTELESKFNAKYSQYLSNFKDMSVDQEHQEKTPLCSDTLHKFYNFDKIIKEKYPNKHPASPDTLIFKNNIVYCVEFKNLTQKKASKHKSNIQKKVKQGKEVLLQIFKDLSINCENLNFEFCLVYKNPPENKHGDYAINIESRKIHFGLKSYTPELYKNIYTQPVDFFRAQFIKKINPNLPC